MTGQRETAILSSQTLFLLNSPFVIRQAESLASRVIESTRQDERRVREAFRYALQRNPTDDEIIGAVALVSNQRLNTKTEQEAWAGFCQALLITNEFRYVD